MLAFNEPVGFYYTAPSPPTSRSWMLTITLRQRSEEVGEFLGGVWEVFTKCDYMIYV